jgi:hypothetical protein
VSSSESDGKAAIEAINNDAGPALRLSSKGGTGIEISSATGDVLRVTFDTPIGPLPRFRIDSSGNIFQVAESDEAVKAAAVVDCMGENGTASIE